MLKAMLKHIGERVDYHHQVYRIVESQAIVATTTLVDDLEEQALLEELLDDIKPPYREGTRELHYLISTPFRYPPLKYGSRFGDRTMASFFYASEEQNTVLAECAYYRFAFFTAMEQPYAKAVQSEHTIFCVCVDSTQAVDLTQLNEPDIIEQLTDKQDYSFTQRLGKVLVNEHEAKVIRFYCARADVGINVAVANPSEITSTQPLNPVNWLCHTTKDVISFNTRGQKPISFEKTYYCVDGIFPVPA
jgi:hypothetical protein